MKIRAILTFCVVTLSLSPPLARAQRPERPTQQQTRDREQGAGDREREKRRAGSGDDPRNDPVTSTRPYRALFGGASNEPELRQTLNLTFSASEVYDDNLLAEVTGPEVSPLLQASGFYTNLVGDLAYRRVSDRITWAAGGGVNSRYYSDLGEFVASDYHTAGGFTARTSRRSSLTVNQAFSHSPVYLLGLFATTVPPTIGDVITPVTDYTANDDRSYTSDTSGAFTYNFSRRASVTLTSSVRHTRFVVTTVRGRAFNALEGGGTYVYGLSRQLNLRLGYIHRRANYQFPDPTLNLQGQPVEHDLDIGFDLQRALSSSRRTMFTLKGGSAIVSSPILSDFTRPRRQFRILADAMLTHQMGETWQLSSSYQRGTGLVDGLAGPVFSDALALAANGFLNDRTDLAISAGYSQGTPAAVGTGNDFLTYTGSARLRVGLSRRVAATAEYIYYFYDFTNMQVLIPGLNPRVRRNSVRAGITLWTPLKRR